MNSQSLHILQLRSEYRDNGPGSQPLTLAMEMRARGHQVFFTGSGGVLLSNIQDRGFHFDKIPTLAVDRRSPVDTIKTVLALRRVLKRNRIDVVHAHNAAGAALALVASKTILRRVAVVQSVRGVELRSTHQWRNRIYRILPIEFLAVSDFTRRSLLSFGVSDRKITVSFNGVDTERFNDKHARRDALRAELGFDEAFVVGHVGAFSGWKGQDVLVRALTKVADQCPALCLLLVGDGPAMAEVREIVSDHGLTHRVHFAGFQRDVSAYLEAMDLYSQPSTEGEMLPNAIIEAMATGRGWVGSDISGLAELSGDQTAGQLLDPGDVDGLAAKLREIAGRPEIATRMGEAARKLVANKFAVRRVVDVVLSVYGRALRRDPS